MKRLHRGRITRAKLRPDPRRESDRNSDAILAPLGNSLGPGAVLAEAATGVFGSWAGEQVLAAEVVDGAPGGVAGERVEGGAVGGGVVWVVGADEVFAVDVAEVEGGALVCGHAAGFEGRVALVAVVDGLGEESCACVLEGRKDGISKSDSRSLVVLKGRKTDLVDGIWVVVEFAWRATGRAWLPLDDVFAHQPTGRLEIVLQLLLTLGDLLGIKFSAKVRGIFESFCSNHTEWCIVWRTLKLAWVSVRFYGEDAFVDGEITAECMAVVGSGALENVVKCCIARFSIAPVNL